MSKTQGKHVYSLTLPVRWCDLDAFGHVNNSVYFSYFEQARISWWESITPPSISFGTSGPVIINAHCTFLKPIFYPETLTIQLYVGPAGRSSHECYYQIYSAQDSNTLYAEGSTKVVWVDRKENRSIPLPDYIKSYLPESL